MTSRFVLASIALLLGAGVTRADAGDDPIVVRAGQTVMRVSDVSIRAAALHAFERKSFGETDAEVRSGLVRRRLVPEVLVAEAARAEGLTEESGVRARIDELLAGELRAVMMREVDESLTDEEIRVYCESRGEKRDPTTRGAKPDCARDHLSYRIALRREKVHQKADALVRRLREQHVRAVDQELLTRISVSERGVTSP